MRKLFILVPLLAASLVAYAILPSPQNITLFWDYPDAPSTNITFVVHYSGDASAPLPWTTIRTVPGTNFSTVLTVIPAKAFYYITASNFWGESDPSNVAGTPAPPVSGVLSVRKGP